MIGGWLGPNKPNKPNKESSGALLTSQEKEGEGEGRWEIGTSRSFDFNYSNTPTVCYPPVDMFLDMVGMLMCISFATCVCGKADHSTRHLLPHPVEVSSARMTAATSSSRNSTTSNSMGGFGDSASLLRIWERDPAAVFQQFEDLRRTVENLEQRLQHCEDRISSERHSQRMERKWETKAKGHAKTMERKLMSASNLSPATVDFPDWVTCKDQSDEIVTKHAPQSIRDQGSYSCVQAKNDGVCGHPLAPKLCPKTCDLCPLPGPWSWCKRSHGRLAFCLAANRCDSCMCHPTHCLCFCQLYVVRQLVSALTQDAV